MRSLIFFVALSAFSQNPPTPPTPRAHSANSWEVHYGPSYLGVAVVERDGSGLEVKYVDEGSPAAKAGIKANDIIVEYKGRAVESMAQFIRAISETSPGAKVALSLLRNGNPLNLTVTLGIRNMPAIPVLPVPPVPPVVEMPDLPRATMFWKSGMLGIESEALHSQLADYFGVKQGVLVRAVSRQSPAERAGLKAGDVIVSVSGKPVAATSEVTALLNGKKSITLGVVRNRKDLNLEVNLYGS